VSVMHLPYLIILNILNAYVFWLMWSGFYAECNFNIFYQMLAWSSFPIVLAVGLFSIRNSPLAMKLVKFEQMPQNINKERVAYLGALIGAYALSSTSIIVAAVVFAINGSIDIWALGENT
jgi:cellulose synthase/poly-beta-1,6-N-acetylglucosamine synthase-like glycosyltransferase